MTDSDRQAPQNAASKPLALAVLLSGSGRTLQNLAEAIAAGRLHAEISLVISSSAEAYGLTRAKNLNRRATVVARKGHKSTAEFSDRIWQLVREQGAQLVVLAGFLHLLDIPDDFAGRVINIHPALLPAFGGKGMYGHHVHEAVLAAGCKVSGCTVHLCDQSYDTGPILVQRTCEVMEADTPDTLAARVFEQECIAYPQAIELIAQGRVQVEGHVARILAGPMLNAAANQRD